jgi:hypothetical protein
MTAADLKLETCDIVIDDPGRYRPQMVFYTVRGHAWDHLDPDLPKFEHMPPM